MMVAVFRNGRCGRAVVPENRKRKRYEDSDVKASVEEERRARDAQSWMFTDLLHSGLSKEAIRVGWSGVLQG